MMTESNYIWPGWETVRLIGRGSFGSVYEIQRQVFDDTEKAALKVISIPQNPGDIDEMYNDGYDAKSITSTFQSHLKSIVAEYSLMRKLNGNANIVHCEDVRYVQHEDGIGWDIFIKMELLTPLAKALGDTIDHEMVIKIAKDMCAALEVCREHNIVHRDIKPQNIFVSDKGAYKLGDFGIAKTVEKTMGGTKIGTYKYMAPEVYNNQPYGTAADIYSLGLVLYWLLNERRMPFMPLPPARLTAGMEEEARSRRFSGEEIPAPKNGSEELKKIVLKACAFDPKERYASAQEMLAALNDLTSVQEEPVPFYGDPAIPVRTEIEDDRTVGLFLTLKPETKPVSMPEPKPVSKPELKLKPETVSNPEPKPEPEPVSKPEPKLETKPEPKPEPTQKHEKESIVKGILGGLLGAILGGLYVIFVSQYNDEMLAITGGFLVGFCTPLGYRMLAKSMSKSGFAACIVLVTLSTAVSCFLYEITLWTGSTVFDLSEEALRIMQIVLSQERYWQLFLQRLGGCLLMAPVGWGFFAGGCWLLRNDSNQI